ncbi:MAG: hypothetical protein V1745_01835, partial [Patescibacteria group bacterium]
MGLFSSKPAKQSYLGVDFGMSGVKIVELLNEKGRARLVTYAYADVTQRTAEKQPMEDVDATAA